MGNEILWHAVNMDRKALIDIKPFLYIVITVAA